jgi:hypothetical protein
MKRKTNSDHRGYLEFKKMLLAVKSFRETIPISQCCKPQALERCISGREERDGLVFRGEAIDMRDLLEKWMQVKC